jgi:hypothetical protein
MSQERACAYRKKESDQKDEGWKILVRKPADVHDITGH